MNGIAKGSDGIGTMDAVVPEDGEASSGPHGGIPQLMRVTVAGSENVAPEGTDGSKDGEASKECQ